MRSVEGEIGVIPNKRCMQGMAVYEHAECGDDGDMDYLSVEKQHVRFSRGRSVLWVYVPDDRVEMGPYRMNAIIMVRY